MNNGGNNMGAGSGNNMGGGAGNNMGGGAGNNMGGGAGNNMGGGAGNNMGGGAGNNMGGGAGNNMNNMAEFMKWTMQNMNNMNMMAANMGGNAAAGMILFLLCQLRQANIGKFDFYLLLFSQVVYNPSS